jgi:hypothetical protein
VPPRAKLSLPVARFVEVMLSPEKYRKRAKEARNQANACRNEWERQGLLIIAEQCERLAAYKDLTAGPFPITAPAKDELKVAAHPRGTAKDGDSPDLLVAKP